MDFSAYREEYHTKRKRQNTICLSVIALAAIICSGAVHQCQKPQPAVHHVSQVKCTSCHTRHMAMSLYFEKFGSKTPDKMAEAVLKRRSPKLLARIAVTESNGNPHIRNYGYKKAHDGAFGINRNYWGKVSKNPIKQAEQAEDALETFVIESKGNISVALNKYGGDITEQVYADKIIKGLDKVP